MFPWPLITSLGQLRFISVFNAQLNTETSKNLDMVERERENDREMMGSNNFHTLSQMKMIKSNSVTHYVIRDAVL